MLRKAVLVGTGTDVVAALDSESVADAAVVVVGTEIVGGEIGVAVVSLVSLTELHPATMTASTTITDASCCTSTVPRWWSACWAIADRLVIKIGPYGRSWAVLPCGRCEASNEGPTRIDDEDPVVRDLDRPSVVEVLARHIDPHPILAIGRDEEP
jgi:hypothetical protein